MIRAWDDAGLAPTPLQILCRSHGLAIFFAAGATVAIGCGLLVLGRMWDLAPARTGIMTLLALTAWVALTSAPLAAGAADRLGAFCRGQITTLAAMGPLAAIALVGGDTVDGIAATKIYAIWAAMALTGTIITRFGRQPALAAVIAVTITMAAASSLFWSAGLLGSLSGVAQQRTAASLVMINPAMGVIDATAGGDFIWAEQPRLYQITRMGQDFPAPPASWPLTASLWGAWAVGLLGTACVRRAWLQIRFGT